MESLRISQKILSRLEIEELINSSNKEVLKDAIRLTYIEGLKIADIIKKIKTPRRTLQGQLNRLSKEIFGYTVTFEQLRQSCIVNLLNLGYTPEYINKFMGYSRKDYLQYRLKLAGYLSPKLRYKILKRDNFKCKICGSTNRLHIDHIKPVSKGGKTEEDNLRVLCEKCNLGKGGMLE